MYLAYWQAAGFITAISRSQLQRRYQKSQILQRRQSSSTFKASTLPHSLFIIFFRRLPTGIYTNYRSEPNLPAPANAAARLRRIPMTQNHPCQPHRPQRSLPPPPRPASAAGGPRRKPRRTKTRHTCLLRRCKTRATKLEAMIGKSARSPGAWSQLAAWVWGVLVFSGRKRRGDRRMGEERIKRQSQGNGGNMAGNMM